jgi:hypothetical protein
LNKVIGLVLKRDRQQKSGMWFIETKDKKLNKPWPRVAAEDQANHVSKSNFQNTMGVWSPSAWLFGCDSKIEFELFVLCA